MCDAAVNLGGKESPASYTLDTMDLAAEGWGREPGDLLVVGRDKSVAERVELGNEGGGFVAFPGVDLDPDSAWSVGNEGGGLQVIEEYGIV